MKLVAGLGNPGRQYENTRHNVGFEVLSALARQFHADKPKIKFEAEITEIGIAAERVMLLAPQTYMNASGRSIGQCVRFYQIDISDILVVCDDMNLDVGRLRLRAAGSAGGQKGLADTIRHLGTQDFARLRIGIGRPSSGMNASSYVLGKLSADERDPVDRAIQSAADCVECWATDGIDKAMNRFNAAAPNE